MYLIQQLSLNNTI